MYTLNCKGRLLVINKPIVMGIINITPDSFYVKSRQKTIDHILTQAEKMFREGAVILDIGGQSTRPGAEEISMGEEMQRVVPAIAAICKAIPEAILSVDTYRASVAVEAVAAGASIVNDISGGKIDHSMLTAIAGLQVPFVCTHMKGTPADMQRNPVYENVTREVLDYFIKGINICQKKGINDVIIDPGIGFGKQVAHNFTLLKNLPVLKMLEKPILIGVSRKSLIYKTLRLTAEESLNGTTALHAFSLMHGADILRVHDVKEAVQAIDLRMQLMH